MSFPYSEYRGTKEWQILSKALRSLERNRDIVFHTKKEYVVGYLASKLAPETAKKDVKAKRAIRRQESRVKSTKKKPNQ